VVLALWMQKVGRMAILVCKCLYKSTFNTTIDMTQKEKIKLHKTVCLFSVPTIFVVKTYFLFWFRRFTLDVFSLTSTISTIVTKLIVFRAGKFRFVCNIIKCYDTLFNIKCCQIAAIAPLHVQTWTNCYFPQSAIDNTNLGINWNKMMNHEAQS
jgi:hypothetical protein